MLDLMYKFVTPWAIANKRQILKNRILGKVANIIYPLFCKINPIRMNTKEKNREFPEIIVSLTSFPARIEKIYLCINSLLRQNVQADKVILWLADSQFKGKSELPEKLLDLEHYGLEIRFCEDLRSYKKVFYTAQEYKDSIIVTVDDDVLYPESWMKYLLMSSKDHPGMVVCYRAHCAKVSGKYFAPYETWNGSSPGMSGPSIMLVPTGVGGVLYPVGYFSNVDFDIQAIRRICPTADDLWLKSIGLQKMIPVVKVFPNTKEWFTINKSQREALFSINTKGQNLNDKAMKSLIDYYGIDVRLLNDKEKRV